MDRLRHVAAEAKRRKLYTSTVAYVAVAFGLIQVGDSIFEPLGLPPWSQRMLIVLLALGLPVVVVLAWIFDVGPGGVTRTSSAETRAAPAPAQRSRVSTARQPARPRSAPPARPKPGEAGTTPTTAQPEAPPDPARVRAASLGHVRHELRTPINAIIGYSEMLLEDAEEGGDASSAADLAHIREAGRDLLARVDRILDPERIAGAPELDVAAFGAQIRADLRDPATAVIGYSEMLLEAPPAGMERDLDRILGAARRLLELSTDIVQVAVLPADGSGATASMEATRPIAEGVLSRIQPVGDGHAEPDRQGSLLVVDDNPLNRDLLSRQLARRGYRVATCENGREALERMESENFDVVLLDILMPEMDGVETLGRIQADARLRETPVIMISSLNEIDGAIRCLELGAADYVTKPFHPTLLDARIGAAIESRRGRDWEARYREQLEAEHDWLRRLALAACPPDVAERIRVGDVGWVEDYDEVAVLCCDLGFALRGGTLPPGERAARFERWVRLFEEAALANGVDTVLCVGSTVLAATGIPTPADDDVARLAATAAAVLADAGAVDPNARLRLGLHCGPASGGVLGGERLSFQLWGDAFDLARGLEAAAAPGTALVSPAAQARLGGDVALRSRGVVELAGGTQMRSYELAPAQTA